MKKPSLGRFETEASKVVEQNSYISAMDYNDSTAQLCLITPAGIHILDSHSLTESQILKSNPKMGQLTDLRFADEASVISCSSDGYLRLWDLRESGRPCLEMASTTDPSAELKPLLCCDLNLDGRIACAGSEALREDAFILFWDIRDARALMGGYWDSHSKDVSQVRFHPSQRTYLLTSGTDGLVNVFDIEEDSEDDALLYTLNAECAVNNVCWLPQTANGVDRIAVITTEEEFQSWVAEDAEPKLRKSRDALTSAGGDRQTINIDHLVKMIAFDDGLSTLVSASNDGNIGLWSEDGELLLSLSGPHTDLVRAAAPGRDPSGHLRALWTAGEDGVVCYWKENTGFKTEVAQEKESVTDLKASSSLKSKQKLHNVKPYNAQKRR